MRPIISKNCRIRHPDQFQIGRYSIVDDFCYFSTRIKIGICSHIAPGCTIGGGKERLFTLGDYSSVGSGVKIYCTSENLPNDVGTIIPREFGKIMNNQITGDVSMGNMTAIGVNSVILPNNHIPEGTVIGALSFVPPNFRFKPWSVYAGIPVKFIKRRNKKNVIRQARLIEGKIKSKGKK